MEIKGDEFLKNIQVKQEEESLREKINQSESIRQASTANPYSQYNETPQDQELGDILLNGSTPNGPKDNKKKYVILGIALVLLFVIILVLIKLLSSNNEEAQFEDQTKITQEKLLNDQKIQQEYQKILTDKLKKVNENSQIEEPVEATTEQNQETKENPLDIPVQKEPVAEEPVIEKTTPKPVEPKPVVKKEAPKPAVKTTPKPTPAKTAVAKGVFVQIGAFSKKPTQKYLETITSKGYSYTLHPVTVNGKNLLKLLIGPYNSRSEATKQLNGIKKSFNAPNAYILQL